jgi:hypothetical protein
MHHLEQRSIMYSRAHVAKCGFVSLRPVKHPDAVLNGLSRPCKRLYVCIKSKLFETVSARTPLWMSGILSGVLIHVTCRLFHQRIVKRMPGE